MTVLSDLDDDIPLDALIQKKNNENNNGNNEPEKIIPLSDPDAGPPVIPLTDPDAPDPNAPTLQSEDSASTTSDSETASSSKTSTTDAQTLMEEILAEKKRKAQERQKTTLEELKKAAQDAAKDAVDEIQNSNKIREEAGPALPPDNGVLQPENGASEPPEDQPVPVVSKRNDRRASFVLRKEKKDGDDDAESDMEVSDDEDTQGQVEKKKAQIEMNVKIPQMMPRSIQKTRQSSPSLVGPKRVGGATSYVTKKSTKPIAINISKKAIETVVNHIPDPKPNDLNDPLERRKENYDLQELQTALEEILKELEKYKITTAMQNEAVYWTTLVQESVPKWSLVPSLEGIYEPLVIVDQEKEDQLNQAAINELMGDLNKKAVAEKTEGVGAWKSRQKVNKMFLARTIKNQMVTELMFEKQRKVKQLNTEAADEEKKSKKKRRKNSTSSSDSEIEVINENEKAKAIQRQLEAERQEEEARNVCPLPLPSDISKEERELTLKAIQELTREASAFIKGRNAKKKMSSGYELGANLNQDGTFKQGQAFVASAQQSTLQSSTVAQAVANAKQLAAKVATGNLSKQVNTVAVTRPQGGTLGELLNRGVKPVTKSVISGEFQSAYIAQVGKLADCSFSDAILGYSWMNDAHWGVFAKPTHPPEHASRKRKRN